ncbi:hypothetical protein NOV72_03695 [Caballeronia novacaledonica]|uniref:Uncharacterized protein n=1 Tax=Caballeronia novacaledonica TaxID=1544861 RepID=A0A2U3I8J9_9BURK|nr:hypothetical protein [Caballeronia novacaledonica]SPB16495.1 hypothetical protein NOV72_03695 [Caballeronia novacaledonica]
MNRTINDNSLLRDVERLQDANRLIKAVGVISMYGFGVACVWFLCVAVPAKALWQ